MQLHAQRILTAILTVVLADAALPQKSDAELKDDIAFARGLASEWGFVALAEKVLTKAEGGGISSRMKEELALARCDIYAEGARRHPDPAERDRLLSTAISSYEAFIDKHPFSTSKDEAEAALVNTAFTFARSLSQRLEDAAGEERVELAKTLDKTLVGALAKTGDLVSALEANPDKSDAEMRDYGDLLLNRGGMLLLIAKNQEEGALRFQQAIATYEKCAAVFGEASPYGLRAFIGIGDVYSARLQWRDAADFYGFVTEIAIPANQSAWQEASKDMLPEEKQRRFLFVQLGTPGLVTALSNIGNVAEACKQGLRFHNIYQREGLELVSPFGDLAMLALARVLVDAGGFVGGSLSGGDLAWHETREEMEAATNNNRRNQRTALDLALSIAQQTNERNRGNILQVRAQTLIADIITRPGVEVAPSVLAEAAQGKYNEQDYLGAIESFQRVLAALEHADDTVRADNGAAVLNYLGRSLARLERHVEAMVVFEEAVDSWKDPNYDKRNAQGFYDAVKQVRRQVQGDPIVDALFKKAERAMLAADQEGEGGAEIAYRQAERAYQQNDFRGALELFGQVPDTAPSYEKALAYKGVCHYKLDDYAAAEKAFDEYLNRWLRDSRHALSATDSRAQAKRAEARATATFYWGLVAFQKDEWKKVIEILGGYEDEFPQQDAFAPAAMYMVLIAHQNLKDEQAVETIYKKMLERYKDNTYTGKAATDIYQSLRTEREAILAKDPERAKKLLYDMARYMKVANDASSSAPFNNLRLESTHWMELEEWATAEDVLERLVARFGTGDDAENVRKFVVPDLGKAYYKQKKVQEAADTLRPLMAEGSKPTAETAHIFARCLAGWAEVQEVEGRKQIARVPGVATGAGDYEQAVKLFDQLSAGEEKWTVPWLAYRFDSMYGLLQWSQLDSKKAEPLQRDLTIIKLELGGDRFRDLADENLRELFTWLASQR